MMHNLQPEGYMQVFGIWCVALEPQQFVFEKLIGAIALISIRNYGATVFSKSLWDTGGGSSSEKIGPEYPKRINVNRGKGRQPVEGGYG